MEGPLVPEQRASDARTALLGVALLLDAAALLGLRHSVTDVSVLRERALFHFALLFVDLFLTRVVLARRSSRVALRVALLIEAVVLLAWMQAFGSTSTSLMALGPALVLFYRVACGRGASAFFLATLAGGQVVLFAAESAGTIAIAPLFTSVQPSPLIVRAGGLVLGVAANAASYVLAGLAATKSSGAREAIRSHPATKPRAAITPILPRSRPEPAALAPVVPGYRIGDVLGRGGMGDVHRASRESDGMEVAIKILHSHLDRASDVVERFEREALFTEKLPRERVARVLEVGHADGLHYLVMDLLSGEDLAARLARVGTFSVEQALVLVEHLSEVLDAAHAEGIVHRDVKPQNVFVEEASDRSLEFRLLDFGVARLLEDPNGSRASKTVGLLGTPGYLAPEQVSDAFGAVSARTDVFAVGAVVYRALTGRSAFPSRQAAAAIHEAVHLHPPLPSSIREDLPTDLDCVIAIALAKEQSERYSCVADLARDLRLAYEGRLPEEQRARARALREANAAAGSRTITSAA